MAAPNSYKDPYWSQLASNAESKIGLPDGLLVNVMTKGERSNADQISSAGAKTPFQITPTTRKLILDKYGLDPYLSPENSAQGAALLLKESLDRNKGDQASAVAEYHGGTDRSNWGPKTQAYVQRVLGQAPQDGGSTFQRALAKQQQAATPSTSIAAVYDAYRKGIMSPEDKAQFEQDVKSGAVMLPKGASLISEQAPPSGTAAPEPITLPQQVSEAYASGQMSEQDRADLERDIQAGLVRLPPTAASLIPDGGPRPTQQGIIPTVREPSLADRILGTGEAALATGTGLTTGALGMIGGTVEGIAKSIMDGTYGTPQGAAQAEQIAAQRAEQMTYAPRTEQGQAQTQAIGELLGQFAPLGPMTGELAQLGAGTRMAVPGSVAAAERVAVPAAAKTAEAAKAAAGGVKTAAQTVAAAPGRAMEAMGLREPSAPSPAMQSAGAAATEAATQRATQAESLPVPITLTKGAQSREAGQLAFEKEQIKGPLGEPLRQRAEENNLQALQNFESVIDSTGAAAPDIIPTGNKVVDALSKGYKEAKARTNAAYAKAKNSEEASASVDPSTPVTIGEGENAVSSSLIDYLNSQPSGLKTTGLLDHAKQYAVRLGVAEMDDSGKLIGKPTDVRTMEALRKEISQATGYEPVEIRDSTVLKKLIDAQTEPVAGPLYKQARALREQQARKYENRAVVARLITNRRGMEDPKVAIDQVFNKSILGGSPDEITFLKRVLNTSGNDGQQAWRELQGATVSHIRDEATKGMGLDSNNNPIVSPAKLHQTVSQLDKNGRLDIVLGKKNADVVRNLNEVVRYVNTVPPGTLINNSGTAATLLAAIGEAGATGALTGLPVPVLSTLRAVSKAIQNKRISAKINEALNLKKTQPSQNAKF